MRLLFLTSRLPFPPHRGDKLKIYNLIKQLSRRGHEITLVSFVASKREETEYVRPLLEFCVDVKTVHMTSLSSIFNCFSSLLSSSPFQVSYFKSIRMKRVIESALASKAYGIIHVHLIRMAQYVAESKNIWRVLDLTDAGSLYLNRFLKVTHNPFLRLFLGIEAKRLERYEQILERFDTCLVCSDIDREVLHEHAPNSRIDLLYNGIDLEYFVPDGEIQQEPYRIVYTGNMSYFPNVDGVVFFVREVFPRIKRAIEQAKLFIVGQNPPYRLRRLESKDITVTGFVPDIRQYYLRSTVAVAPIRFGAGTLNKVLEPMALGLPVVATSIAAEGLPIKHGKELLIADSADDFAEAVVKVLLDTNLQKTLGASAKHIVRDLYDWERIVRKLEDVYEQSRPSSNQ